MPEASDERVLRLIVVEPDGSLRIGGTRQVPPVPVTRYDSGLPVRVALESFAGYWARLTTDEAAQLATLAHMGKHTPEMFYCTLHLAAGPNPDGDSR